MFAISLVLWSDEILARHRSRVIEQFLSCFHGVATKNGGQIIAAIFDGTVSVTPLELDRTHETSLNHISYWASLLEQAH
jgi:hypothetical protein